ncbi:hypothetical protein OHA72_07675 [Dactylosporangium sp. NBC_01737]|uniref:hypothetical protein n=1 Tax=Dactylosporangium sp. NBC_01737 TaxID=2975959 RepID=UPI002E13E526|nr:hypothetical protein OHA72_07675 [Dactylosporangium sp. NBC_01737]
MTSGFCRAHVTREGVTRLATAVGDGVQRSVNRARLAERDLTVSVPTRARSSTWSR